MNVFKFHIFLIFLFSCSASAENSESYFESVGCPEVIIYDVEGLKNSGNGMILDQLFSAAKRGDHKAIDLILDDVYRNKKSDMDAAIIWVLAGDSGLVKSQEDFFATSVLDFSEEWHSLDDMPHLHAARIYSRSRLGFNPHSSRSYPYIHFFRGIAKQDMKALLGVYLDMVSRDLEPYFEEKMLAAAHHMAACNEALGY